MIAEFLAPNYALLTLARPGVYNFISSYSYILYFNCVWTLII